MGISFSIYKKLNSFDLNVAFSMENGFLVIEGPSGAGKTTILNCLAGIATPDLGEISISGRVLFRKGPQEAPGVQKAFSMEPRRMPAKGRHRSLNVPAEKRSIGYLFQNYALFPNMTVRSNILYGLKNKKEYRKKESRRELLEYAEHMMETLGIAHLAEKNASAISGGEKQRTALARAMVTKPALLLLDEPFSALDDGTKERIYEEFAAFKASLRIPTIFITHDHRETALFADQHIRLQEGRIIQQEGRII